MNATTLQDHPGWQWCTAEGAELHTLLMGYNSSFLDKVQWLEEAENLTLAMAASREKMQLAQPASPPDQPASASPTNCGSSG